MVGGIVLFALALRFHSPTQTIRFPIIPAIGPSSGVALDLLAHIGLRLRDSRRIRSWSAGRDDLAPRALSVAMKAPALTALALVAMVCTMLIAYEALRYRDARAWIRSRRVSFTTDEVSRVARTPSRIGRRGSREV
jgi:hypothetical protein